MNNMKRRHFFSTLLGTAGLCTLSLPLSTSDTDVTQPDVTMDVTIDCADGSSFMFKDLPAVTRNGIPDVYYPPYDLKVHAKQDLHITRVHGVVNLKRRFEYPVAPISLVEGSTLTLV